LLPGLIKGEKKRTIARRSKRKKSAKSRRRGSRKKAASKKTARKKVAKRPPNIPSAHYAIHKMSPKLVFSSGFGVQTGQKPGLITQGQIAFSANRARRFYAGAEVNYTLFAPGTLMAVLPGVWYNVRIARGRRAHLSFGLLAGLGFTDQIPSVAETTFVGFLDIALVQQVDDLISVKSQFRPGLIGDLLSFAMSFHVAFRFH